MDGSPESNQRKTDARLFIALVGLLALIASACGSDNEAETNTSAAKGDAAYAGWASSDNADESPDVRTLQDPSSGETPASDDVEPGSPTPSSDVVDGAPATGPLAVTQSAQVLAYAIEASEELSYTFEQGMAMRMNMLGMSLDIAPDGAFVTGEVSGANIHMRADIGTFMVSSFESFGLDPNDPLFAGMLGEFESMSLEVWTDESTMVLDMSGLANSLGSIDPAAAGELGVFADGPVKVDLDAIAASGGVDAASIVQEFGQGAQVTDPAALIEALRLVDAVTETGQATVGSTPVTVYYASLSMADYYSALGMDISDQLGSMEGLGFSAGSDEAELFDAFAPAIENLVVDMTIMLDDGGLVRRMETSMDLGELFSALGSGDDVEGLDMFGAGEIEMTMDLWQNFDNYGAGLVIEPPDAVDRTSELLALLDS
jgi:hypothetical protein